MQTADSSPSLLGLHTKLRPDFDYDGSHFRPASLSSPPSSSPPPASSASADPVGPDPIDRGMSLLSLVGVPFSKYAFSMGPSRAHAASREEFASADDVVFDKQHSPSVASVDLFGESGARIVEKLLDLFEAEKEEAKKRMASQDVMASDGGVDVSLRRADGDLRRLSCGTMIAMYPGMVVAVSPSPLSGQFGPENVLGDTDKGWLPPERGKTEFIWLRFAQPVYVTRVDIEYANWTDAVPLIEAREYDPTRERSLQAEMGEIQSSGIDPSSRGCPGWISICKKTGPSNSTDRPPRWQSLSVCQGLREADGLLSIRAKGGILSRELKIFIDTSEDVGSGHLALWVRRVRLIGRVPLQEASFSRESLGFLLRGTDTEEAVGVEADDEALAIPFWDLKVTGAETGIELRVWRALLCCGSAGPDAFKGLAEKSVEFQPVAVEEEEEGETAAGTELTADDEFPEIRFGPDDFLEAEARFSRCVASLIIDGDQVIAEGKISEECLLHYLTTGQVDFGLGLSTGDDVDSRQHAIAHRIAGLYSLFSDLKLTQYLWCVCNGVWRLNLSGLHKLFEICVRRLERTRTGDEGGRSSPSGFSAPLTSACFCAFRDSSSVLPSGAMQEDVVRLMHELSFMKTEKPPSADLSAIPKVFHEPFVNHPLLKTAKSMSISQVMRAGLQGLYNRRFRGPMPWTDVVLRSHVDGYTVRVHAAVLILRFNFFRVLLEYRGAECRRFLREGVIILEKLNRVSLLSLVEFAYTGAIFEAYPSASLEDRLRVAIHAEIYQEHALFQTVMSTLRLYPTSSSKFFSRVRKLRELLLESGFWRDLVDSWGLSCSKDKLLQSLRPLPK